MNLDDIQQALKDNLHNYMVDVRGIDLDDDRELVLDDISKIVEDTFMMSKYFRSYP